MNKTVRATLVLEIDEDSGYGYGQEEEELFCEEVELMLSDLLYDLSDTKVKKIKVKVI